MPTASVEATAVGRFVGADRFGRSDRRRHILLTDFKGNLQTLLEPDREVVTWRSVNECLSMIDRDLN